eukprot:Seg1469.8 transcript_id=Seg1469.8/GoldUCD/mRNA.D3Y31 product="hypothetical protein" protein_id=Seg1469.8/GoldUCD/D3Y31
MESDEDETVADPDFVDESTSSSSENEFEKEHGQSMLVVDSVPQHSPEDSSTAVYSEIKVTIPRMQRNDHGGRIYDKAHSCLFCGKVYLKIARHLRNVHSSESDVAKILAINEKSKEGRKRQKLEYDRLRLKGNFYHNLEVLKCGGELKVCRRPGERDHIDFKQFVPCTHCLGFVQKHELWRHVSQCPFNEKHSKDSEMIHRKLQYESQLLLYGSQEKNNQDATTNAFQDKVISIMRVDEISLTCKTDDLILAAGKSLFEKGGSAKATYISEKMRSLARLLIELRKISGEESATLTDAISPAKFDLVIIATRNLCSHIVDARNDHLPSFHRPSLALQLGHNLRRSAAILRGIALRKRDTNLKGDVEAFLELINAEWENKISSAAMRTLADNQFRKTPILPVTSDLVKLREYLLSEVPKLTQMVRRSPTLSTWRALAELTAARILLFNKRRGNEGTKLEIKQFQERPSWTEIGMEEMTRSLKPLELELCKRLDLVYIKGKRGRKVPILMTKEIVKSIEALIASRDSVGVSDENKYVFAAPTRGSAKHLRGPDCLNTAVSKVDLENPNAVKSTKLRKYVATVSQIIDLSESELEWLARHMGHDLSVHREYYRLHDHTLELSKVSRLLMAVDEGNAAKFQGKKLSEITVDELALDDAESEAEPEAEAEVEAEEGAKPQLPVARDNSFVVLSKDPARGREKNKPGTGNHKIPWKTAEVKAVMKFFLGTIKRQTVPGKQDCLQCINDHPILANRNWKNVKDYVRNQITKTKRLGAK